ncbi:MAG: hypothetical protein ACJ72Z_07505 [Pyrinomonadaceae bacterium]
MTAKVAAFLITLVLTVILAIIGFIVLVLALNGYSESDATYSFGAYGIFAFLIVFAMAALAGGIVHLLLQKEFKTAGAASTAIIAASAVGLVAIFICIVIGIGIAEYFRRYS